MTDTLRNRLRQGRCWKPPALARDWRPVLATKAVPQLERMCGDVDLGPPPAFDPHEAHAEVLLFYESHGALTGLPRRCVRQLPWIAFLNLRGKPILARSVPLAARICQELGRSPRATQIVTFLRAFLREYPVDWPSFDRLLAGVRNLLRGRLPRLAAWQARVAEFHLLDGDGPRWLAEHVLSSDRSPTEILELAGLDDELQAGRFCDRVYLELLRAVRARLLDGTVCARDVKRLQEITRKGDTLRFPSRKRELAEALLEPQARHPATLEIQELVQPFLIRVLGDLRISPGNWQGVSVEASEVMLAWLVGTTLETFFEAIDKTADRAMWDYRRRFWLAYHARRHILGAWVALGSHGASVARRSRLQGSGLLFGGDSRQSVLLLKVGSLTIVEWSHSGACRVWRLNHRNKPALYQPAYNAPELRADADRRIIHSGSWSGSWQDELAEFIADQTGIRVDRSEYMLRRSS